IQLVYHLDRQGCNHCPTCWYGLVVPRWRRSPQFGDARLLSEVSWLLPVTCVSRVAKKLSFRSSKSGLASCPAVGPWHGYRVSSEEDAHWKSFWAPTTFRAI